jgi:hypothetical protein
MRGPGIILFTKIKSPAIRVGYIDHDGIRNEANKNTRTAIAKIMENNTTRNQPRILFRTRFNFFDLFDLSPDPSPQGRGTDSELSPQGRGTDSELSPQERGTDSEPSPQGGRTDSEVFLFR